MNKKELQLLLQDFQVRPQQEKLRIAYAKLGLQLYDSYISKSISEKELIGLAEDLLTRNPDKKDTLLRELDSYIYDLSMDAIYFADNNYQFVKDVVEKIVIGIRNAQAPSLICYYQKLSGTSITATNSVVMYSDGKTLTVLDAKNEVSDELIREFDGKKITLLTAQDKLPKKIGTYTFSHTEKSIYYREMDEI